MDELQGTVIGSDGWGNTRVLPVNQDAIDEGSMIILSRSNRNNFPIGRSVFCSEISAGRKGVFFAKDYRITNLQSAPDVLDTNSLCGRMSSAKVFSYHSKAPRFNGPLESWFTHFNNEKGFNGVIFYDIDSLSMLHASMESIVIVTRPRGNFNFILEFLSKNLFWQKNAVPILNNTRGAYHHHHIGITAGVVDLPSSYISLFSRVERFGDNVFIPVRDLQEELVDPKDYRGLSQDR